MLKVFFEIVHHGGGYCGGGGGGGVYFREGGEEGEIRGDLLYRRRQQNIGRRIEFQFSRARGEGVVLVKSSMYPGSTVFPQRRTPAGGAGYF